MAWTLIYLKLQERRYKLSRRNFKDQTEKPSISLQQASFHAFLDLTTVCVLEWHRCSRAVCAIPLRQTGSGKKTWLKSQVSLVLFQFSLHSISLSLPYHLRQRQIPHFRCSHFCAWKLSAFCNLWFYSWKPQWTNNSGYLFRLLPLCTI